MFPKFLVTLVAVLFLLGTGCSSLSDSHRRHMATVYDAHGEIVAISSQLQDIQQVMLYAGRVNDSPIADLALDIAIAIQGEPDDKEKAYASTITEDLIRKEMERANKLLKRKLKLIATIDSQKNAIARDITSVTRLETKYSLISQSLAKVAVFAIFALFFLLAISRWLP